MSDLAVFSGNCLKGICGDKSPYKDMVGEDLYVGDIVLTYTQEKDYIAQPTGHLSAVVCDKYDSFLGGNYQEAENPQPRYFIMGIKNVPFYDGEYEPEFPKSKWLVQKIKGWDEVVEGEHWKAFGFNYKLKPDLTPKV